MSWRRNAVLGLISGGLAVGGFAAAHGLAEARQGQVVVMRFLTGYYDGAGRFVPTGGRNSTNVERNALLMFIFSGGIDMGRNRQATVPLTLDEQAALRAAQASDPDFDPAENGIELGQTPRKLSADRAAYYVATGSVSPNSIEIAAPQLGGTVAAAPGQFFKVLSGTKRRAIPNRLLFNPRYTVASFNIPHQIDYNPQGFAALTTYNIDIDGGANPESEFDLLTNLDGNPLGAPFHTSFTTSNSYVQDYSRPAALGSNPPDGATGVLSDADIELTFSEPMNLATFVTPRFQGDDQYTVVARYSQNPINGSLVGQNLFTSVRVKPETGANVLQLRPLQGFGVGPYEIEVIVRNGVTDLSGNNINRQLQIYFKTAYNQFADIAGLVQETFGNTTFRDSQFGNPAFPLYDKPSGDNVLAYWNGGPSPAPGTPGFLVGSIATIPFVVWDNATAQNSGNINLWGSLALHFQNLYTAKDMGARPRTITSFSWSCRTPALYFSGLSYPNTLIKMGHANDQIGSSGFPAGGQPLDSHFRDTPVTVVPSTTYNQAGKLTGTWVAGPKFAKNFNTDGTNAVIFDCEHAGNGSREDRWYSDVRFALNACTFYNKGAGVNNSATWYFETQFTYLTPGAEAQSLFYDTGREDNRLLPQQLIPSTQPQGTSITFVWQGAKASTANPLQPDLATLTPWVPDIRSLSTYRFIRFRATLLNNVTTGGIPTIDTIYMPFTHK
jgi:hypothetical protein